MPTLTRPADLLERHCTSEWAKSQPRPHQHDLEWSVGFGTAWLGGSHAADTKRVWDVHVHVDHRGEGHGRHLMEVLTAYADGMGLALDLFVYVDNEPAIRLYQSVGFVIERTNPRRDGNRTGTHYMRHTA